MSISTWAIAGEAGILRGIIIGMTPGIVTVLGGLTRPGMVPVGDSAGDGAASMPAGVVPGMVVITVPAIGAVVTGVEATGVEATGEVAITDTITIIIIAHTTIHHADVRHLAVIQPEEILPVAITRLHPDVQYPIGRRTVHLL